MPRAIQAMSLKLHSRMVLAARCRDPPKADRPSIRVIRTTIARKRRHCDDFFGLPRTRAIVGRALRLPEGDMNGRRGARPTNISLYLAVLCSYLLSVSSANGEDWQ